MKTLIISNTADFQAWCRLNNLTYDPYAVGVRHIPNLSAARGLGGAYHPHRIIELPSADPSAVAYLRQAGYQFPPDPGAEQRRARQTEIEKWTDRLKRWFQTCRHAQNP